MLSPHLCYLVLPAALSTYLLAFDPDAGSKYPSPSPRNHSPSVLPRLPAAPQYLWDNPLLACHFPQPSSSASSHGPIPRVQVTFCPAPSPQNPSSSCWSRYSHGLPVPPPCPSECWALPALGLRLVCGLPPAGLWLLLHLFLSSFMPMSHLLPLKTKLEATPSSAQRLRPGPAGRRTGWKRRKSPQTTIALDQALLPDGHLVSHLSPMPLASFLVWDEAFARNPSWEGTSDTGPQYPPPVKSLHSHGDALHTFPQDRLDPKTLDSGRPLRGGACPPRPPLLTDGLH